MKPPLSPLEIDGYAKFTAIRGKVTLFFEGYVAKKLNAEILCGAPFMERNRLVQELHNRRIIIDGKHVFLENSPFCPNLQPEVGVRRVSDAPSSDSAEGQAQVLTHPHKDLLGKIEIGENVPDNIRNKLNEIHC